MDVDNTSVLTHKGEMNTKDKSVDMVGDEPYFQKEFNDFFTMTLETSNNSSSPSTQANKKRKKSPPKVTASDGNDKQKDYQYEENQCEV